MPGVCGVCLVAEYWVRGSEVNAARALSHGDGNCRVGSGDVFFIVYEVVMAVQSLMLPLGSTAPPFELPDVVSGQSYRLESFTGKAALLMMFICRHCPYVQHIEQHLAQLGRDYEGRGVGILGISSNDPAGYPDDAPDRLKDMAQHVGFRFPLCFDATQEVAKAYRAACTPDFYLFDGQRRLVYRGRLDDSRPGNNRPVTGRDLRGAIDAVLGGTTVQGDQKPSIGCSIKWKPGNAPA